MSKIMYGNFKNSCILANKHHRYQKKCYKRFSYTFSLCKCSRKKRLSCQLNARDNCMKGGFNQNGSLIIS